MNSFINIILIIVNIISFVVTILFSIFGLYDEIMGPAHSEKLLKKLHIPLSYNGVLIIGIVSILIMFISYILRTKLLGRM